MDELIRKRDAIKAICEDGTWLESKGCVTITMATRKQRDTDILENLPPVQPGGWLEQNKDRIFQAGKEGREVEFRIGGRLFAIREKAQ